MYSLDWPYLQGAPLGTASFKSTPEDFQVNEFFNGDFSGEGEHILLRIEKRGLNTEELVKSLARLINKPVKQISYAGLKDRQALTTQWISIHAPGERIPGVEQLAAPGWRVIDATRHSKKIKPGFLAGNQFKITLRCLTNISEVIERIERIKICGVPNYFGEQRFGRGGRNLIKAEELLVQGRKVNDRFLKGMYCSAARSWIFNLILSRRVLEQSWNQALPGDVMQLQGSQSIFTVDEVSDLIRLRIQEKDASPASPLPGRPKNKEQVKVEPINTIYNEWPLWIKGLEQLGLEEAWRANILHPHLVHYDLDGSTLELTFNLPPGAYATAVLRELVSYETI